MPPNPWDTALVLTVNDKIQIPLREFQFTFSRSSGPGGQNVNKVNTKAQLRWAVATTPSISDGVRERFHKKYRSRITVDGELVVQSQRFRDRGRNVADCLSKLRAMILSVAEPPVARKKTRPTVGSKKRHRKSKELKSRKKELRKPPRQE